MVSNEEKRKKDQRTREKREKTICVNLHKKVKTIILAQLLPTIHDSIEHVHFPRQDPPKFAFIVCKDAESVPKVTKAITKFKNDDIGVLKPRLGPRPEKPQRPARPLRSSPKTVLDMLTLIVTATEKITQAMVEKLVPNFKKITTFKTGQLSTYLVQYDTAEKAFEAFEDITVSPVEGVTVKYYKRKVETSTNRSRASSSNKKDADNIETVTV